MNALPRNNANVGAGYIERNGEQYLIRAPGQIADIAAIEHAEPKRLAGLDADFMKHLSHAEFGQQFGNEIEHARRHAAGEHQHVGLQAGRDPFAQGATLVAADT